MQRSIERAGHPHRSQRWHAARAAAWLGLGLALAACPGQPERSAVAANEETMAMDGAGSETGEPTPDAVTGEPEGNPAEPATEAPTPAPGTVDPELRRKAEQGPVRVLVETAGGAAAVQALVAAARAAGVEFVQTIDEESLVRMKVDAAQLDRVMATGLVETVHEDRLHR